MITEMMRNEKKLLFRLFKMGLENNAIFYDPINTGITDYLLFNMHKSKYGSLSYLILPTEHNIITNPLLSGVIKTKYLDPDGLFMKYFNYKGYSMPSFRTELFIGITNQTAILGAF